MNLHDKVVLISGASSGFGEACARRYAEAGARVILTARSSDKLHSLAAALGEKKCHVVAIDLRNGDAIDAMVGNLPESFREVDILINNAGLALGLENAWQSSLDDWDQMLDTNCRALARLTRRLLPGMVERNRGHVVNVGSVSGNWPYPGGSVYGATKAFVQQFSRNLRCDLLGKNIRVTNIEPGMAETGFSITRFHGDEGKAKKVYENTDPLRSEDIAETIFWCTTMPEHVNINTLEVMPTCQAWAGFAVDRTMKKDGTN